MYVTLLLHCRSRRCRGCGNTVGVTDIDLCADRISCVYDHPSVSVETSGYVRDYNRFVDKLVSVRLGSAVYAVRSLDQSLYHSAVSGVEVEVQAIDSLPVGQHAALSAEQVIFVVNVDTALHKMTVSREEIVSSGLVVVPACHHAAAVVSVVEILIVRDCDPAALDAARLVKVVAVGAYLVLSHEGVSVRSEVIGAGFIREPVGVHVTLGVHVVAGAVEIHPAELDAVIVVKVSEAVALGEAHGDDHVVVILVHIVDIYVSRYAGDGTLMGGLPDGVSRDLTGFAVLRDPDIVAQCRRHVGAVKVCPGVDDGVVSRRGDHITEGITHCGDGVCVQSFLHFVFDIESHGEVDVVTFDPL